MMEKRPPRVKLQHRHDRLAVKPSARQLQARKALAVMKRPTPDNNYNMSCKTMREIVLPMIRLPRLQLRREGNEKLPMTMNYRKITTKATGKLKNLPREERGAPGRRTAGNEWRASYLPTQDDVCCYVVFMLDYLYHGPVQRPSSAFTFQFTSVKIVFTMSLPTFRHLQVMFPKALPNAAAVTARGLGNSVSKH